MDELAIIKTAIETGGLVLLAVIVWQFIGVLRLAITSQSNAQDAMRRWYESEMGQTKADLVQEKAERMKLESRFDEQCEETAQLKNRIVELEAQIVERQHEIDRLKEEIKQLKSSDAKKDERIKEQSERIKELERELDKVKRQRDELVERLDALLVTKDGGNGGDKKASKIADQIDERPAVKKDIDVKPNT